MRRVAIHGLVAVLCLAAAYVAWSRRRSVEGEPRAREAEVVVASFARRDITGIHYDSKRRTVDIDMTKSEPPYWIEVVTRTEVEGEPARERPDGGMADGGPVDGGEADGGPVDGGGAADGGAAGPPVETEVREEKLRFVASKALDDLVAKLAPLKALRRLGKVATGDLEEFGLAEPEATITIRLARGERVLKVGGRTYGGGDRYVLDGQSGEGFLLPAAIVRDLDLAMSVLAQRDLHRFDMDEVASVTVVSGGKRLVLTHRDREDQESSSWVPDTSPDASSEPYDNWMEQLGRLRAVEYLGPDIDPPGVPEGAPTLRVEYTDGEGGRAGFTDLVAAEGEAPAYYARSEATSAWVKLSPGPADTVLRDAAQLVAQ